MCGNELKYTEVQISFIQTLNYVEFALKSVLWNTWSGIIQLTQAASCYTTACCRLPPVALPSPLNK